MKRVYHNILSQPATVSFSNCSSLQRARHIPAYFSTNSSNPLGVVSRELAQVRQTLPGLVESQHLQLTEIAQYYFKQPSKLVCPTISLLFARATNGLGRNWAKQRQDSMASKPPMPSHDTAFPRGHILPSQVQLAEALELIHTASLIHDDVIDGSTLRRGVPSAPAAFGNKEAILGGTYVLGQAWNRLAKLQNPEATSVVMSVLEDLVQGELMQLKEQSTNGDIAFDQTEAWKRYLRKTYLKTASLVAKGALATVILGGCDQADPWRDVAFSYGQNLGIAFQLIDDALDYESVSATLGKPGGADLHLGLVTAPALYAAEEHPEIVPLILRHFSGAEDIETTIKLVLRSSALPRTKELAREYADKAKAALQQLPESEARGALGYVVDKVLHRKT